MEIIAQAARIQISGKDPAMKRCCYGTLKDANGCALGSLRKPWPNSNTDGRNT